MPNWFDTPATDEAPSKKGLFSALGNILTKTAIGIESPSALGQLQQRELEAEAQFQEYKQKRKDYEQERKYRMAQDEMDNFLKTKQLGLTPVSGGMMLADGQVGDIDGNPIEGAIQAPNGQAYQSAPDIDALIKQARLEKLMSPKVPSDFDLQKYASQEADRQFGDAAQQGDPEFLANYTAARDKIYQEMKAKYGVTGKETSDAESDDNFMDTNW